MENANSYYSYYDAIYAAMTAGCCLIGAAVIVIIAVARSLW